MRIETFMTSEVFSVSPEMTVRDAIGLITTKKISGAPVVDSMHKVISVISEGDLLKLAASGALEKTIASCLTKLPKTEKLMTLKKTDTFTDAYKMFLTHPVHRIVITDANGRLQGIVSRSNVLRLLVETKSDTPPETKTEE